MTRLRLAPTPAPHWPSLAWIAACRPGDASIRVTHGPGVEVGDDWLCEAVWDGDFQAGDFDRTEVVAGSGIRLRDDRAVFVSSGSTVDRLQVAAGDGAVWVSNSLPCLLRAVRAAVPAAYPDFYWDFRSIVQGISRHKRTLATPSGPVELVYFDNVVWDGRRVRRVPKPSGAGPFTDFAGYRGFLASSMQGVAANLADAARRRPFRMLGTVSAGYDSPTVTVLASEAGCEEALSFDRGRDGGEDSGEAIAAALGVRTIRVQRAGWEARPRAEVPFIAANAYGEEVHFTAAEAHLSRKVLLTGYHGDKAWAKATSDTRGDLVRGDPSGLALTEYRLHADFVHCPVPFWGARRIGEIVAVSNAAELRPWDVPGDYSRPICRRIVEEAGVPRGAFGVAKRATSVVLHNQRRFLGDESMERYLGWVRAHRVAWLRRGRLPPLTDPRVDRLVARTSLAIGSTQLAPLGRFAAYRELRRRTARSRLGPTYLRRFVFPWAVEEAKAAYADGA